MTAAISNTPRNAPAKVAGIYIVRREAVLRRRNARAAVAGPGSSQDS